MLLARRAWFGAGCFIRPRPTTGRPDSCEACGEMVFSAQLVPRSANFVDVRPNGPPFMRACWQSQLVQAKRPLMTINDQLLFDLLVGTA